MKLSIVLILFYLALACSPYAPMGDAWCGCFFDTVWSAYGFEPSGADYSKEIR